MGEKDIPNISQNCILSTHYLVFFKELGRSLSSNRLKNRSQYLKLRICLKLGPKNYFTDIKVQKIDRSILKRVGIVLTSF